MHQNRLLLRTLFIAAGLALGSGLVLARSGAEAAKRAAVPDTFSADFTANVKPDIKGDLDLDISGSVTHSYPLTRIEFVHPLTLEQIVLLIDGKQRHATLLYPDTLNGFSFGYDGKYYEDWPEGFVGYLSEDADDHPKGWKKRVAQSEDSASIEVTLGKDGLEVVSEINAEGRPVTMNVTTPKHSARLTFSNYKFPKELDPSLFAVPPGFSIEKVAELEDDKALPL